MEEDVKIEEGQTKVEQPPQPPQAEPAKPEEADRGKSAPTGLSGPKAGDPHSEPLKKPS